MANVGKEKLYKQYGYVSRYESFPYYYSEQDNRYYYGLTSNLNTNIGYVLYTVKDGDSWDSISLDYYGSPIYYWIICDFNGILDALEQPIVGTAIKIPAINSISFVKR